MFEELENFIIRFQEQQSHVSSGELHSFVESFLPRSKDPEIKRFMFTNLIAKMPELFAVLTNFKNDNLDKVAFDNEKELKALNLQGAVLCLKTLIVCLNYSETQEHSQSLLHTGINVLYQAYTHCKESEALYGDSLEDFTEQLAIFLKEIQIVQTAVLSEFERVIALRLSDSEVSALVTISEDLGKLCELVFSLDTALAAKLWRIFIKIITKYPEISQQKIKVDSILSSLVSEVINIADEYKFKLENEESVEESDLKIFLFLTNLVMKIFHTFHNYINDISQNIVMLALKLSDLLILSYSPMVSDSNQSRLKTAVRSAVKPIIPLFYCDKSFQSGLQQLNSKELLPELHMAHVLLKLSALDLTLSNKDFTKADNVEDIFKDVLLVLQSNKPFDDIKLASIKIPCNLFRSPENIARDSEELVAIYQHAYLRLSEYSKSISDSDFRKLESYVLEAIVSSSELVSLLVSDVWIYRLRCSNLEYLHISILNMLQKFSQFQSNFRYKQLLKRMLKFLPSEMLVGLLKENRELKYLISRQNKVLHRYGIPELTYPQTKRGNAKTFAMISLLINELKKPILEDSQLIAKACCLLELFSMLVTVSQNADVFKFTELAKYFFSSEIYEVQIAVLTFLKAFNSKILDEKDIEFKMVVNVLATLLAETLQSRNYVVKYEAFDIYASLAQSPSLVKVCRQTVVVAPNLATNIKSYFSKTPFNGFLTEKERMQNLQKQLHNTIRQPEIVLEKIKNLLPLKSI